MEGRAVTEWIAPARQEGAAAAATVGRLDEAAKAARGEPEARAVLEETAQT